MAFIRPPAVAGSFYPADPQMLAAHVRRLLAGAGWTSQPVPKALIAPHAGYVYSGPIAATAYAHLRNHEHEISRVVLIGPAHRVSFRGIGISTAEAFRTPLGDIPLDPQGTALLAIPGVVALDEAHREEHSLEVHLPFLQTLLDRFTLLPLIAGAAPDQLVADVLEAAWGGPETLIVISSDLSHYHDYHTATERDRATADAIARLDPSSFDHDGACGRTPLGGLLTLARRRGMRIEPLDIRNSGDTAGPRDRVVGYGSWALYDPRTNAELGQVLLGLARRAIERRLTDHHQPLPIPDLPALNESGACFVTLHRDGALRGCIGSPMAWRALAEDVIDNAARAAFSDPRFPPVGADEMFRVTVSVSLLSAPEPLEFADEADLLSQVRPGVDGLVIEDRDHHALFLPAVWDQLPDPAAFLGHLKTKAGLGTHHWSDRFQASRFTVTEYHEAQ
jgi:AmmeMemoRadiSam system protein B/AmmeMemoRadiSam system protein A